MKHFELYRWYKQDDPVCNIERDLSILRIGKYWLLNFNLYHTRVMRSVGVTANFGFTWPGSDLFSLNLYLYKKNFSFSLLQRDYDRLWDDIIDTDWGGPSELTVDEGHKNEGA